MRRRRLIRIAPAVAIAAALTASACTAGADSDSGDKSVLTLGMTADIQGWDPSNQPSYQGWSADAIWDTLVRCDENAEPEPGLAETWEFSEDQRTFTAHLRDGVEFSDGTPVNAAAVKASYEYVGSHGGAQARYADLTIETPDDLTVSITWPAPNPLIGVRICEARIASPDWLATGEVNESPVGSGPYTLDEEATTRGSVYVFEKNEDYWDADSFPYQRLELRVLESETAALNAIKTGQIDGTLINQSAVEEAETSDLKLVTMRGATTRLLLTDHLGASVPALGDVNVRRAMNMVFDRDAIAEQLYRGHADPAYQIFRPGSDAYIEDSGDPYPYDVDAAKALMAEAGYADGFTLKIPYMDGQNLDLLLPYVTDQLSLLNITVEQVNLSGPEAISELLSGEYPVPLWQLGNYGQSLQDIQDYVLTDGIWNVSHQEDETINALWEQVLTGTDEERVQAQQEINRYITEQAWFVPMAYPDGFYAYSPDVTIEQVSDYSALHPLLRDFK